MLTGEGRNWWFFIWKICNWLERFCVVNPTDQGPKQAFESSRYYCCFQGCWGVCVRKGCPASEGPPESRNQPRRRHRWKWNKRLTVCSLSPCRRHCPSGEGTWRGGGQPGGQTGGVRQRGRRETNRHGHPPGGGKALGLLYKVWRWLPHLRLWPGQNVINLCGCPESSGHYRQPVQHMSQHLKHLISALIPQTGKKNGHDWKRQVRKFLSFVFKIWGHARVEDSSVAFVVLMAVDLHNHRTHPNPFILERNYKSSAFF